MTEKPNHYIIPTHLTDEQVERFRAEWNLHDPDVRRFAKTLVRVAGTPIQCGRKLERVALYTVPFDVVRAVAELPDRTSPDGDPEMMQVTTKELTGIVRSAIDAHDGYCAAHDTARLDWLESRRFPELRKFDDGFLVATDQVCRSSGHPTARAAIDAAMNAENGNG
ncbi:hypothetical protein LDL36_16395 [Komagataeibacter sp. FNDCR1]|uniref:Uncharacterized protein n=2 Tax=Gluconacetobacter entanii TaxID=108528 RepID=A0A318PTM3_9PROT|nr:hypothetical protein [Komagataeibacter sp. FNDCR1]PYD63941.1 hypothetical protein CFR72_04450 [Gluconacetobacter entanii]